MATDHHPSCDQKHTSRQACNRVLALAAPEPRSETLIVSGPTRAQPLAKAHPVSPHSEDASSAEAPGAKPFEPLSRRGHVTPPSVSTASMPEPSPWVTRAWEDTAAAVGAVATPPSPRPAQPPAPQPDWFSSRLPLVGGIAAAALALLLLVRRRPAGRK